MSLKYRTSAGTSASNFTDLVVKVGDTLPVGSEIDYDGQTAPAGWQEVDDPNVYSTSETRIGTWYNGKPIYRKVYEQAVSLASQTWVDTGISASSMSAIINATAYYFASNTMAKFEVNANKTSDGKVQLMNLRSIDIYPTVIVLEYVKTTD